MLSDSILQYLALNYGAHPYQLWVYVFFNKRGLTEAFGRFGNTMVKAKFEDFYMGFNQASEKFLMVDVGSGKEAADAKIKGRNPPPFTPAVYPIEHVHVQHTLKTTFAYPRHTKLSSAVSVHSFCLTFYIKFTLNDMSRLSRQWICHQSPIANHGRLQAEINSPPKLRRISRRNCRPRSAGAQHSRSVSDTETRCTARSPNCFWWTSYFISSCWAGSKHGAGHCTLGSFRE